MAATSVPSIVAWNASSFAVCKGDAGMVRVKVTVSLVLVISSPRCAGWIWHKMGGRTRCGCPDLRGQSAREPRPPLSPFQWGLGYSRAAKYSLDEKRSASKGGDDVSSAPWGDDAAAGRGEVAELVVSMDEERRAPLEVRHIDRREMEGNRPEARVLNRRSNLPHAPWNRTEATFPFRVRVITIASVSRVTTRQKNASIILVT